MAKKELFIHVGMGKTGTTALQEFFWANRKTLSEHGVHYPKVGVVSGAHHLLSPHIPLFLKDLGDYRKPEQWAEQLSQVAEPRILISSELMAWAAKDLVIEFCHSLQHWFDLRIVFYLRRQDSQFMAAYNQQIKAGTQKLQIDQIIPGLMKRFDYHKKLAPWEECVGEKNIRIRPYERQQFFEGDIRRDFLVNVLGIHDWEDFHVASGNSNPRLSLQAMEYKRLVNNVVEDLELLAGFNDALLDYSRNTSENSTEIYSNQPSLSPLVRRKILTEVDGVNQSIAKKYLQREDGALFLDSAPKDDGAWCEELLSATTVWEIHRFLAENYPHLHEALRGATLNPPEGMGAEALAAAEFLSQRIDATPKARISVKRGVRRMVRGSRRYAGKVLRKVSAGLRR